MGKATIIEAQNSATVYEDGKQAGILGKLKGIFADYKCGTRNSDRWYTERLWDERVFGSEDVMEALQTKTLFGELDHPDGDRCDTKAQNAAITITKLEKKPEEGVIYGEAEILDTPTGRIVKALADSGAQLGISSRGIGEEVFEEGKNIIDPDTYDFITFDVVVTPANKKARVSLTESKKLNLLYESINKSINESDTVNQLCQIKQVITNTNIENKGKLINMVEGKINSLSNKNVNLTEANKNIAINLLKKKLNEQASIIEECNTAGNDMMEQNKKLVEERDYYMESKDKLKAKLKESKEQIVELNTKLQESQRTNLKNITSYKSKLIDTEESKKLEINKVTESIDKLKQEKEELQSKFNKLLESNKVMSKNIEANSKILVENKELQQEVAKLKEQLNVNKQKLQESATVSNNKVKQLENKVRQLEQSKTELEKSKKQLEEAQDRFSKLAFTPIGKASVKSENANYDYSQEDIDLINAIVD